MGAVHHFSESNLVGEVETLDVANLNFGSVDEPKIVPADNPVTIGENSFIKYLRIKFTGTWTEISNMKFWKSSGDYKTEETIKAEANVAYATPTQDTMAGTGVDDIPISEESALTIQSAEGAATIVYGATGVSGYTGYIKLQDQSTENTEVGVGNSKVMTFQYDES
jgi:hypothetical protein